MALNKVHFVRSATRSLLDTVREQQHPPDAHVTIQLANHYNGLVDQVAGLGVPAEYLPARIRVAGGFGEFAGLTDAQFTDLIVLLRQLVDVTHALENPGPDAAGGLSEANE